MKHIVFGKIGEDIAEKYLKKQGYKIVLRNYKNNIGEIDIIAKLKDITVFVEVKSRSSLAFSRPAYAVGKTKQNKIKTTATLYLKINNLLNTPCRFDVIEILDDEINHIINAF